MKLRLALIGLVVAASTMDACQHKEESNKLPIIDQAIQDNKGLADRTNPAHVDLISAGNKPAGANITYTEMATGATATATTMWISADRDRSLILVRGTEYVQLGQFGSSWRCDVPAGNTWGAAALTDAYRQLTASRERTVIQHDQAQTFVCG